MHVILKLDSVCSNCVLPVILLWRSCRGLHTVTPITETTSKFLSHQSSHSSGCRVVQSLMEFCSSEQHRLVTGQLEDPSTLLSLVCDQCGTWVAQACLARLSNQPPTLLAIVTSLQGKTGQVGCTQQGTFFLQKLVEVLGGEAGPAYLLHEDILINISTLIISEVS